MPKSEITHSGKRNFTKTSVVLLIGLTCQPLFSFTQEAYQKMYSLDECIQITLKNNESVLIAGMETDYAREQKMLAFEVPKTAFLYTQGQFNSIYKYDNIFALSQTVPSPGLMAAQSGLIKARVKGSELKETAVKAELSRKVAETYYTILHLKQERILLGKLDSLYEIFLHFDDKGNEIVTGDLTLEQAAKRTEAHLIQVTYNEIEKELNKTKLQLQWLMRLPQIPEISNEKRSDEILLVDTSSSSLLSQPELLYLRKQIEISQMSKLVEKHRIGPDFVFGYFNQSIYGPGSIDGKEYVLTTKNRLHGFQLGISLPLFYSPYQARIESGRIQENIAGEHFQQKQNEMNAGLKMALNEHRMSIQNIVYYKNYILKNSRAMAVKSLDAYNKKEINYIEYLEILSRAYEMERNYLHEILDNNLAVIQVNYYLSLDQK